MDQLTSEKRLIDLNPSDLNPSNPLTDLNPSDESCIYSTLIHIIDHAKYLNVEIPCVTLLPIVVD